MIEIVDRVSLALVAVAGVLAVARVLRPGSLPNKVLGADNFTVVVAAGTAIGAAITRDPTFLDVLVIVTLLGFITNLTVARYIEKQGAEG